MSLYNMVHGVNPTAFFVLPVLGKHPEEYPRFRDCFMRDQDHPQYDDKIHIYTRVGGGNREDYESEIEEIRNMEGFITDYDDEFDSTYATFVFEIPEKWKADVELVTNGNGSKTSKEYQDLIIKTFPKIEEKIRDMFKPKESDGSPSSPREDSPSKKE